MNRVPTITLICMTVLLFILLNAEIMCAQTKENRGKNNPYSPSPNTSTKQDDPKISPVVKIPVAVPVGGLQVPERDPQKRPTVAQRTYSIAKNADVRTLPASEIYRVSVGDVLLVNVKNSGQSAGYFTVRPDGTIDFPLAGDNVVVSDQTIDNIEDIIASGITLFPNPQVEVKVREYASHKVTVSGMVDHPGEKNLQREAVPLYVIRAEAGVGSQATKVLVRRSQLAKVESYDLHDVNSESILIYPGSTIEFTSDAGAAGIGFYYISGEIATSGQKQMIGGLTLYQAVIASGGTKGDPKKAVIRRKNEKGVFLITEHNLRSIKDGKAADPALTPGDIIEIRN